MLELVDERGDEAKREGKDRYVLCGEWNATLMSAINMKHDTSSARNLCY
jgi:hypothetical protein